MTRVFFSDRRANVLIALAVTPLSGMAGSTSAATASNESVIDVKAESGAAGIVAALARARVLQQQPDRAAGPIRVVIAPGEYVFDKPLRLGPEDSGSVASPLEIEAATAGTVQLVGAPRLRLAASKAGIWDFEPLPKLDRTAEKSGGQFYVSGHRAVLARQPNSGSYWMVDRADKVNLLGKPDDIAQLASIIGRDSDRAILSLMQSWTAGDHRIKAIDSTRAQVEISPKPNSAFLEFGASQRWFVSNLPGAFDASGEWIGQDGVIRYRPLVSDGVDGDAASRATAYWPRKPLLLEVKGTASKPVHHVTFRNLGFAYTGLPTPPEGQLDGQAASKFGAALEISYAKSISLLNCTISHVGAYGLWFKEGVTDSEVSTSVLDDLGAGGIKVGMEEGATDARRTGGNRIEGNVVMHTGRQFPGAVGIWIGRSFDNQVASNIVAHTSYTGISVGWAWGYEDASSGNNAIINNVLFDIGQKTLSDVGGIYTLGRSPGTLVAGNFIRSVEDYPAYGAGAWGIYNDEGSTQLVVRNNVVVDTRSGGYSLNYGRDLDVRDNLFYGGRVAEVRWTSVSKSGNWRFNNNGVGAQPSRGAFTTFNEGEGSPAETLRAFKAGSGATVVQVKLGASVTDVSLADDGTPRIAAWRKVIDNARALIARARDAGVRDLDLD